ncbi:hypothetical protein MASR1M60_26210 [Rhodocyclaceae bacterium]
MSFIASSIPGRIRLRHTSLRNPRHLAQLATEIGTWSQVQSVVPNVRAGSLRVLYDAAALQETDCINRCETIVQKLLPHATLRKPVGAQQSKVRGRIRLFNLNRLAKRGMLASLTVSMLLAAAGAKKWHALTGGFFLHALGIHLWTHRRHLLK